MGINSGFKGLIVTCSSTESSLWCSERAVVHGQSTLVIPHKARCIPVRGRNVTQRLRLTMFVQGYVSRQRTSQELPLL